MCDIALFLDSLTLIPALPKSPFLDRWVYVPTVHVLYSQFTILLDANTIGSIASVGELYVSFYVLLIGFMTLHPMLY